MRVEPRTSALMITCDTTGSSFGLASSGSTHSYTADAGYVTAGWIFAAFRALHSAVHCTVNIVMLRFWLYAIATAALWFMVIRAALGHFGVV